MLFTQLKAARRLPSPAGTALRVLELSKRDDAEVREIADVIMSDPALSGRLLKFANSSLVGAGREVASVRDAVLLLGLRTVKLTALGFSLMSPNGQIRCPGFDPETFWSQSFVKAAIARHVTDAIAGADREEAFTAGLLADIGRLAFAQGIPKDYSLVLSATGAEESLIEVERRILGVDHIQFGAHLLEDWELPQRLVHAVEFQNEPQQAPEEAVPLARIISLAARLAPAFSAGKALSAEVRDVARDAVENELRLDAATWQQIADRILSDYLEIAKFFDANLDSETSVMDLYAEAQEEASRVGMVAQLERTQALEENKELLRRASTDPLTGVANRAKFEERIGESIKSVGRGHGDFALLLFDLDHFKKVNDTYGHQAGDLVLSRVARTILNTLRETDLLARYGGEEFAIVAPYVDRKGACLIAARVRQCVEDLQIPFHDHILRATISVGMSLTADYGQLPDPDRLIADADAQLYLSKNNGRNTWSYLGRSASQATRPATPEKAATS